ncbi:butyryl-CoA:acetate CoA-transferase [Helicobacter marmotae]|uniref:Butyryl-CoA:acetate CoA-transferase n=1 Tax=Helicobacter marmotae TaxID=152490 RepID=A0A3D8I2L3_9HELI|nr:butyryl-CoA:acetate CoA-transferase [Helicobacter marmotae]RDU59390.1 butyryl-CoA:acetate CoA-transferase [Helicobacter marmotae]
MDIYQMYKQKQTSAAAAVGVIKSGDWVDYGWAVTTPIALDAALSQRIEELDDIKLRGGVLVQMPEVFKVDTQGKHASWHTWHASGIGRKLIEQGLGFYMPMRYSELPRYYKETKATPSVVMLQVAPMDNHGYFNFGLSASHLSACIEKAKVVIVEVNENMPRCLGGFGTDVHISQVDMIVEGDNPPLVEVPSAEISQVDEAVAKLIVEEISDGACIQLGIGGMPNAVGSFIAKSDLKDLGVHTEVYVDAFVKMSEAGKVNGRKKSINQGRQTYSFAMGSKKLYDFLNNNPECMSAPVDYTNDIRTIAALDNFISINNAVDIDLFGQVNSESSGTRHISGAGGQLDFVLGAYLAKNGKSFICCSSTMRAKDGTLKSRILPTLHEGSIITATRANVHYFVTEYGKANLKGLSTWEKCEAIISLAHPDFREDLIAQAEKMKIWRMSNKIRP